ncbi:PREDICTED: bone morphogenetic protein 2-like [Crocodylus porosus]|uniref:bone morphogenetic protein 2-like n=1 Tax=Crocodylus porosus TaxID=8502 RepID=UPI0009402971|nr:PREDICTED: bone morphogenetic protein 2-like [Crocodylus porosus]
MAKHWNRLLRDLCAAARPPAPQGRAGELLSAAMQRLQQVFDIPELPRDVLPRRKPPQFMVDLFNKVADSDGITKAAELLEGNVVRSFEDRVYFDESYFYFNISSVGKNEQMLKAELRVFKLKKTHMAGKSLFQHFCKVEVYEILERGSKPQRRNLISSRLLSLYTEGWEVFNVTETVSKWVRNSHYNHGFLITATRLSEKKMEYNFVKFARSQHNVQDSRNALLVLFTNNDRPRSSSFSPSSSGESLNATNHATVQSIVHTLKLSQDVSMPCCVPTELKSINLLYFDDKENVVLKRYKDMVAASCGCH